MHPVTAEEYDRINERRSDEDHRSELNDLLSVSVEELREIANMTIELTKVRQRGCNHLRVENFAPSVFHELLSRLAMFKQGEIVLHGNLPMTESSSDR